MFRSPSMAGLPSLETMLQDLPANLNQTARHLGISLQTLKKYSKAGQAPRVVLLALFWETRWGRSAANTEAANFATVQHRLANSLERENKKLKEQMAMLEKEIELLSAGGQGAANAPFFRYG